jgi:hypothetical protein
VQIIRFKALSKHGNPTVLEISDSRHYINAVLTPACEAQCVQSYASITHMCGGIISITQYAFAPAAQVLPAVAGTSSSANPAPAHPEAVVIVIERFKWIGRVRGGVCVRACVIGPCSIPWWSTFPMASLTPFL